MLGQGALLFNYMSTKFATVAVRYRLLRFPTMTFFFQRLLVVICHVHIGMLVGRPTCFLDIVLLDMLGLKCYKHAAHVVQFHWRRMTCQPEGGSFMSVGSALNAMILLQAGSMERVQAL